MDIKQIPLANVDVATLENLSAPQAFAVLAKLESPDDTSMVKLSNMQMEIAESYVIDSEEMAQLAAQDLASIKGIAKHLTDVRMSWTRPLDVIKKVIMARFAPPMEVLERAETVLKTALDNYLQEEQRKAAERQRLLAAEAAKEQQKLEARAERAEASGKGEKAAELREQAALTVVPVVAPTVTKLKGVSTRQDWEFEIEDVSLVPREFLMVDEKKLGKFAKAMKADAKVPGVRFYPKSVVSARAA